MSSEQLFEERYSLATVLLLVIGLLVAAAVGHLYTPDLDVPEAPVLAPAGAVVQRPLFSCKSPEAAISVFLDEHERSVYVYCAEVNP